MYPQYGGYQSPYQQTGQQPVFSYPGYQPAQTWLPQQAPMQQPQQQQSTGAVALTGRTVRSAQEATPQEVPMDGTLALFPLSDGTAIIGKRWTPEGTISEVRYVPEAPVTKQEAPSFESTVLDRLSGIERAIADMAPKRPARRAKGEADDES